MAAVFMYDIVSMVQTIIGMICPRHHSIYCLNVKFGHALNSDLASDGCDCVIKSAGGVKSTRTLE